MAKSIADVRDMAKSQFGRDPQSIKFLAMFCPVLGRTEEEAVEKFRDYQQYGSIEGALALFGGWTGEATPVKVSRKDLDADMAQELTLRNMEMMKSCGMLRATLSVRLWKLGRSQLLELPNGRSIPWRST